MPFDFKIYTRASFFYYSPHVESYDVSLYENGWGKGRLIGRYHICLHDGYNNLKEKNGLVKALNSSLADIDIENLLLGY